MTKYLIFILLLSGCSNSNTPHYENAYYFNLPLTQFGCITYAMHNDEIFDGWRLQQPLILTADDDVKNITITNVLFDGPSCKPWNDIGIIVR